MADTSRLAGRVPALAMDALILSYGLDTNGQNARFVRAAQKFGTDKSIISALAIGNADPAGVVSRFQVAADKLGGLEIRSANRASAYFDFPGDLVWDKKGERELRQMADRADVIHLNNSPIAYKRFRLRKPALLHHHGSMFRNDPEKMHQVAQQYRMVQAVSTPDLLQYGDGLHWLPTAYNVAELAAYGKAHRREPDGKVRIVHCPTNRTLKHTEALIEAVRQLEGVELVIVENQTWRDCLAVKATADIVFDQLAFGYGCNAVEAWAMGIPVVSGSDEWTRNWMYTQWGRTPYADTTPETLVDVLRKMVTDERYRQFMAELGDEHVRQYHDERSALTRLAELYRMAIEHHRVERIPSKVAA